MDFKYARQEKWNEQDKFKMFYLSFFPYLEGRISCIENSRHDANGWCDVTLQKY